MLSEEECEITGTGRIRVTLTLAWDTAEPDECVGISWEEGLCNSVWAQLSESLLRLVL